LSRPRSTGPSAGVGAARRNPSELGGRGGEASAWNRLVGLSKRPNGVIDGGKTVANLHGDDYVDLRDICVRNWNRISIGIDPRCRASGARKSVGSGGWTGPARTSPGPPPPPPPPQCRRIMNLASVAQRLD